MLKKFTTAIVISVVLGGCSSVTIQPEKRPRLIETPTYEERKDFFFWGLVGEHRIDAASKCEGKKVLQMQSQQTFVDGLLGVVTLGIYAPHSVKIWCEK